MDGTIIPKKRAGRNLNAGKFTIGMHTITSYVILRHDEGWPTGISAGSPAAWNRRQHRNVVVQGCQQMAGQYRSHCMRACVCERVRE